MCEAELILELGPARLVEVIPGAARQKIQQAVLGVPVEAGAAAPAAAAGTTTPTVGKEEPALPIPADQFITRVDGGLNVIAVRFSDEQIAEVQSEVGVAKHAISTPGVPLLFILAGDFKIPIRAECPARLVPAAAAASSAAADNKTSSINSDANASRQYEFDVLGLQLRVVFPSETPLLVVEHFESVLLQQNALRVEQPQVVSVADVTFQPRYAEQPQWDAPDPATVRPETTATKIISGLNTVGGAAASGLRSGALLLAGVITDGAQYIVAHTDKRSDAEAVAVPETWQAGVKTARVASKGAVKVSTGLAKSLIGVTSVVSDVVAAKLREVLRSDREESDSVRTAKVLGVGIADNAVEIYEALTDAARTVLVASSASIAAVVDHKMGRQAGAFVEDGLGLVQDGYDAARSVSNAGAKGIAKAAIRDVARKTLDDEKLPRRIAGNQNDGDDDHGAK